MTVAQTKLARMRCPSFPGDGPIHVTPMREASISVARFSPTDIGDGMNVTMPPEDAFVLIFHLGVYGPHDYWIHGRLEPAEAAPRGSLFVVDLSGEPRAQITKPCDKLMFHLSRAALDEIAEEAGAPKVASLTAPFGWRTRDRVVGQVSGIIERVLAEPEPPNRLFVDYIMRGLAAHFAHTYGGMRPRKELVRGGLAPWQEKRAKELLAANLAKETSLQDIADECGLTLAHFSRAFKVSTGTSPHAWLQARRLDRAKGMLLSRISLAEVALACGFADQSHFTRMFARSVGVTPGKWRRLQM
jgi:AraC family transcriptional regulator